jgi:hypothetical protein
MPIDQRGERVLRISLRVILQQLQVGIVHFKSVSPPA